MIYGCHWPIHGERANPLDRVVVAAYLILIAVCVWLWLCCVVLCLLATIPVESLHQPRQNGQLLQTHRPKSAPKVPKYEWMCKNCHHSEMVHMFCLVGAKQCAPYYEPAKSVLTFSSVEYLAIIWKKTILYLQKGRHPGKKYTLHETFFVEVTDSNPVQEWTQQFNPELRLEWKVAKGTWADITKLLCFGPC
jgi:hypothetical protein